MCDEQSPDFSRIMTDSMGRRRNSVVPKGLLSSLVWKERLLIGETNLPKPWFEMVSQSKTPFATAITSLDGSKAAFCEGKVLLVGDAFAQFKPHLGMSCNQSALKAMQLGKVLEGEIALEEWEKEITEWSYEFSLRSAAVGQFGLTGKYPEGYVPLHALKEDKVSPEL
jgi:hypothetical protein